MNDLVLNLKINQIKFINKPAISKRGCRKDINPTIVELIIIENRNLLLFFSIKSRIITAEIIKSPEAHKLSYPMFKELSDKVGLISTNKKTINA